MAGGNRVDTGVDDVLRESGRQFAAIQSSQAAQSAKESGHHIGLLRQ